MEAINTNVVGESETGNSIQTVGIELDEMDEAIRRVFLNLIIHFVISS